MSEKLRPGWTTGACATAAAKAAFYALHGQGFPDPVTIRLPKGQSPSFPLALMGQGYGEDHRPWARAAVHKDAGDDPDVTHGALIWAEISPNAKGQGLTFMAGAGVGTVTLPGLPLAVGEPAINPGPRAQIQDNLLATCHDLGLVSPLDYAVTLGIENGEALAQKTWNPRLGILGGLSILGTTGIVTPYSCAAWIHSIHRGVDVAKATAQEHLIACTGSTSEKASRQLYPTLSEHAWIDMGDFVGGFLKYLRQKDKIPPSLKRLTFAGGFAKITKLAQGHKDLHSSRGHINMAALAQLAAACGADDTLSAQITQALTGKQALDIAQAALFPLAEQSAAQALQQIEALLSRQQQPLILEVLIVDRQGTIVARQEKPLG